MLSFIGRGSAFNVQEGNTAAFYKLGNDMLLIDCGSDVYSRLRAKNVLDDVDQVWVALTHFHPDHVGSLGDFIFYMFYVKGTRTKILTPQNIIYDPMATKFTHDLVTMLDIQGVSPNFYELVSAIEIPELNTAVGFSPTRHIPGYLAYSLTIRIDETTMYYSGDSIDITETPELFDIIYQEISFTDVGVHCYYKKLKDYGIHIEKVFVMHIDDSSKLWLLPNLGIKVVDII